MAVTDTLVVVTRWYGGVQLGPDRWRHINAVARDAVDQLQQQAAAVAAEGTGAAGKAAQQGRKGDKKGGAAANKAHKR